MNKIVNDSNASTISFPTIYRLARYSLRKNGLSTQQVRISLSHINFFKQKRRLWR